MRVHSYEGRVEVMLFKEEFKQCIERLNAAINANVAAAQRKPAPVCFFVLLLSFLVFRSDSRAYSQWPKDSDC